MNRYTAYILMVILGLSSCVSLDNVADDKEFNGGFYYNYADGQVIFSVDNQLTDIEVDSLLSFHELSLLETDSLLRYSEEKVSRSGWKLTGYDDFAISFSIPLARFSGGSEGLGSQIIIGERIDMVDRKAIDVPFGINLGFKGNDPGLGELTRFTYEGTGRERQVYVSGTFNNWSTLSHPMEFRGDSWVLDMKLEPGKHLYRYVVDGKWALDPSNRTIEGDSRGYNNNVIFVYNHVFKLNGFLNAEEVHLQGSFNNWHENDLKMTQNGSTWELPMYLRVGTHAYKFKVDGEWELDPNNPVVRPDDAGFENSFMSIGDTIYFNLQAYKDAEEVFLTGDFNAWQRRELPMLRTEDGWTLPYVLRSGNYQYKFIVDGEWHYDEGNPHSSGTGEFINSLRVIEPNHQFRLAGHSDAEEVMITGSFMDWSEDGYRMRKDGEDWVIDLHLPQGKTSYKFLIDGEWTKDPANSLWEKNEYGTYNSIIWKD